MYNEHADEPVSYVTDKSRCQARKNFINAVCVHIPGTRYHVTIGEKLECQLERWNAADTHAVSLIERELPSATYSKDFTRLSQSAVPTASKFASAIARLGWYRRAQ